MNDSYAMKVGLEGRVRIPVEIRRAAGIDPGDTVVMRIEEDHVVLISRDAIKRRLQGMFAGIQGSMSEELITERRAKAASDLASP